MRGKKYIHLKDLSEIRKIAWGRKKPPNVNKKLEKHLRSAIGELVRKDARKEALKIITSSSTEFIGQFLYYHHSDVGNVACLVLDAAKEELVKQGKMKQGKGDAFGGWVGKLKNEKK